MDCGHLSAPKDGSLSGDLTVFPSTVSFDCDPGFVLASSSKRSCQANGNWSGSPTICYLRAGQNYMFEQFLVFHSVGIIIMVAFMSNYSGITEAIEGIIKSGSESCTLHEKRK